jgi:hypothetical protein
MIKRGFESGTIAIAVGDRFFNSAADGSNSQEECAATCAFIPLCHKAFPNDITCCGFKKRMCRQHWMKLGNRYPHLASFCVGACPKKFCADEPSDVSWYRCGYESIPINTIFRGMNIHLPAICMFTRGTRF